MGASEFPEAELQWKPYQACAVLTAVCPGLEFSVGNSLRGASPFTIALVQSIHSLFSSRQLWHKGRGLHCSPFQQRRKAKYSNGYRPVFLVGSSNDGYAHQLSLINILKPLFFSYSFPLWFTTGY